MKIKVENYQVFLFDFDGLLVNTETHHFSAFQKACSEFDFSFSADFSLYYQLISKGRFFLKKYLVELFPEADSLWDKIYCKKDEIYRELLTLSPPQLMPGAKDLIERISAEGKISVLVTNSSGHFVDKVTKDHPVLRKLSFRVVREDYSNPKPHPDSYILAYSRYVSSNDRVVGFEDSIKGVQALSYIDADIVCVNRNNPVDETILGKKSGNFYYLRSLEEVG